MRERKRQSNRERRASKRAKAAREREAGEVQGWKLSRRQRPRRTRKWKGGKANSNPRISREKSCAIAGPLVREAVLQCLLVGRVLARPRGFISASYACHRAIRMRTARLDAEGRSELKNAVRCFFTCRVVTVEVGL